MMNKCVPLLLMAWSLIGLHTLHAQDQRYDQHASPKQRIVAEAKPVEEPLIQDGETNSLPIALRSNAKKTKPNIVLIYADDLGYGDVGALNPDSKIPTPNIDRLASEGISFTNAHPSAAVCSPSRYSLLTGEYSWRGGMKKGVSWIWDPPLIRDDDFTLGRMLQNEGYSTALIGKWHLGWDWPTTDGEPATLKNGGRNVDYDRPIENGPITRGFDYYFGDDVPSFPPHAFIENDRMVVKPTAWMSQKAGDNRPGAAAPGWRYEDLQTANTDKAIEYIEERSSENGNKPFFLFYSSSAPHTPIAPREEFIGTTDAGRYGDFIHELDYHVGRILKTLDSLDIADNTLVIFTSDNGPTSMDGTNYRGAIGSILEYGHNSSGEFKGLKADAWEGGHRVPFFVKWPGHVKPGTSSGELISQVDFMATFAAILDAELAGDVAVDSYNMLPAFTGESEHIREALVTQSGRGVLSIQKDGWKLILSSGGGGAWTEPKGELPERVTGGAGSHWKNVQLYDLDNDLDESDNIASERPEKVGELMHLLKDYIVEGRSAPGKLMEKGDIRLWPEAKWIEDLE